MIYRQDPETGRLTPNDPPWGADASRRQPAPPGLQHRRAATSSPTAKPTSPCRCSATIPCAARSTISSTCGRCRRPSAPSGIPPRRCASIRTAGTSTSPIAAPTPSPSSTSTRRRSASSSAGSSRREALTPRNFEIDPSGRWLYVANQNSNAIECFTIDPTTGTLTLRCGRAATVPAPTCIRFA